jgi:hypothetical protein
MIYLKRQKQLLDLGKEDQMLFDGESIKKNIVLRAQTKALAYKRNVRADAVAIHSGISSCWRYETYKKEA